MTVSPDGSVVAGTGANRMIYLWSLPDGEFLAGGVDSLVCVWSIAEGRMVNSLAGQKGTSCRVWFTPDGKTLLGLGSDQTVRRWSLPGGEPLTGEKGIPAGMNATVHPSFRFTAGTARIRRGSSSRRRLWTGGGGSI